MTKEQLLALADEYATLTADTAAVTKARAALEAALDAVVRDAERWKMMAHMESNRVSQDTLMHYIANPDKLDYAIHLKRFHDSRAKKTK